MKLKEFLEKYPWSNWGINPAKERIVENLWVFPVDVSREEMWPYIADTSRTNSLLGLPEMEFQEQEGKSRAHKICRHPTRLGRSALAVAKTGGADLRTSLFEGSGKNGARHILP